MRETSECAVGGIARELGYLVSGEGEPPVIADWELFASAARRLGLLPLLDLRAEALRPPNAQAREAWVARQRTQVRERGLLGLCRRTLECLDSAGVRAAALKGCAHASDLHGDASLRPSSDVDVLVPPGEFAAACEALEQGEFSPAPFELNRGYSMRVHYERPFVAPDGAVELHRFFYHPRPYRVDYAAVWSRAQKAPPGWKRTTSSTPASTKRRRASSRGLAASSTCARSSEGRSTGTSSRGNRRDGAAAWRWP